MSTVLKVSMLQQFVLNLPSSYILIKLFVWFTIDWKELSVSLWEGIAHIGVCDFSC